MYRNILVAFDGSASSLRALNEAIRVARGSQATLHVVFVADSAALSSYPVHHRKEVFADARRMLDDARMRMRDAEVGGETALLETDNTTDSIARCLQRHAAQLAADLVVMGTHGRTGLMRLVLGSVAEAFLRHSMCPVLLVRPTP